MAKTLLQSLLALVVLSILTGVVYPLVTTGIAQLCCRNRAEGSLIERKGQLVGSVLIGQPFDESRYFWPRPSATTPQPYNGLSSGGSNLGPTNPAQFDAIRMRVQALRQADPGNTLQIPVDLVTASASGLDPDVSPAAAEYQVMRVARARNVDAARLRALIQAHTQKRQWTVFGEQRVNVLQLNLALDALTQPPTP